jgi:threonine synthase
MPKLAAVQSSGCDPMVRAWRAGDREAAPILHPRTRIATVATGTPGLSYSLLYDYVKAHGGLFESVSDEEAYRSLKQVAQLEGLSVEPATALAFAGLVKMVRAGVIDSDEVVVLNLTGHTFPVEKHLLGEDFIRDVDLSTASEEIPREGLLVALEEIDVGMARVLVIEDDPGASQLVRRILEAYGVPEVLQAYDGGQGIDMIESTMPDLIVLDLMMPGVDGFGVLDYLKSRDDLRDIPVIIVTAKDLTPGERKRLRGQATGLLAKGSLMDGDLLQGLIDEQLG